VQGQRRTCRRCGQAKPASAFRRDRGCRLGRRSTCKACTATAQRRAERRYRQTEKGRAAARRNNRKQVESGRAAVAQRRYYRRLQTMVERLLEDGGPEATAAATPLAIQIAARRLCRRAEAIRAEARIDRQPHDRRAARGRP